MAGFDIAEKPVQVRRVIGYVSQMLSADGALTGYENLLLFARIYGIPARERKTRILDALDFMDLTEAGRMLVKNYSGGMIRRLEIAQSAQLSGGCVAFADGPRRPADLRSRPGCRRSFSCLRRTCSCDRPPVSERGQLNDQKEFAACVPMPRTE